MEPAADSPQRAGELRELSKPEAVLLLVLAGGISIALIVRLFIVAEYRWALLASLQAALLYGQLLSMYGLMWAGVDYWARLKARAIELYRGETQRCREQLADLQAQSDKDYADYEALKRQYNKTALDNEELQRLNATQADRIRIQEGHIQDLERDKADLRQMVIDERAKRGSP